MIALLRSTTVFAPLLAVLLMTFALPAAAESGGGDGHSAGPSMIIQALNLALLLGVLAYFVRKPAAEYFSAQRETVKSEIAAASDLLSQAERKNADWQRKLTALDAELATIRETTRRRAEDERAQIVAEATESAERIQRDAAAAIEQELRRAKTELRSEVAQLASQLAGDLVRQRLTDGDRQRLVDEFIGDIERSGARN